MTCELQSRGSTSAILEKIVELQQEIALINRHEQAHVQLFDSACSYCQGNLARTRPEPQTKRGSVTCELERSVELVGKGGGVSVPRSWVGKRVKVSLLAD